MPRHMQSTGRHTERTAHNRCSHLGCVFFLCFWFFENVVEGRPRGGEIEDGPRRGAGLWRVGICVRVYARLYMGVHARMCVQACVCVCVCAAARVNISEGLAKG